MARQNIEPNEVQEEQAPEAAAEAPVLYYDKDKNPDGGFFAGVPQRHLTKADLDELPKWLQKSVAASPFYVTEAPVEVAEEEAADVESADAETDASAGSTLPAIGGSSNAVIAETEAN